MAALIEGVLNKRQYLEKKARSEEKRRIKEEKKRRQHEEDAVHVSLEDASIHRISTEDLNHRTV